jgi:hypothetical protein
MGLLWTIHADAPGCCPTCDRAKPPHEHAELEESMLTVTEIEAYRENGYLVVADVIPPDWVAKARAKLAELIEASRRVSASDSIYDLEVAHTSKNPRVRRIKDPHNVGTCAGILSGVGIWMRCS